MVTRAPRLRRRSHHAQCLESRIALSASPPTVLDVSVASSSWTPAFYQYLSDNGLGDGHGYSIPTSPGLQDDTLPWWSLDRVRITFSKDVFVDAADLAVSGVNSASYPFADFHYDPVADVAEWVFAQPLGNDRFMLDLDAGGDDPVRDLFGSRLDGDWVENVSSGNSGDGVAGGDFEFRFNVLPGDVVNSGALSYNDIVVAYVGEGYGVADPEYSFRADLDGDGVIGALEWQYALAHRGEALPVGAPVGQGNDAPTTAHFSRLQIDNDAIDIAVSLWDVFDDVEDADNQLTFAIEGVGDPSLFDSYSINAATGELIVNGFTPAGGTPVSGRTEVVVVATDTSGQQVRSTLTVDLHRTNAAPTLTAQATQSTEYIWLIEGTLSDPDDFSDDMFVILGGPVFVLVPIRPDGTFSHGILYGDPWVQDVWVEYYDPYDELTLRIVSIGW